MRCRAHHRPPPIIAPLPKLCDFFVQAVQRVRQVQAENQKITLVHVGRLTRETFEQHHVLTRGRTKLMRKTESVAARSLGRETPVRTQQISHRSTRTPEIPSLTSLDLPRPPPLLSGFVSRSDVGVGHTPLLAGGRQEQMRVLRRRQSSFPRVCQILESTGEERAAVFR